MINKIDIDTFDKEINITGKLKALEDMPSDNNESDESAYNKLSSYDKLPDLEEKHEHDFDCICEKPCLLKCSECNEVYYFFAYPDPSDHGLFKLMRVR